MNRKMLVMVGAIVLACSTAGASMAAAAPSAAIDTTKVLKATTWAPSISTAYKGDSVVISTTDIPNHRRDAYYAVPNGQVVVPTGPSAHIVKDPTRAQSLSFTISTKPTYTSKITNTPLGSIGVMISGSVLFNPYEGDGKTVAMSGNFSLTNTDGTKVWFIDHCNGHPTPMDGTYHYHAGSTCITDQVDTMTGPSHLIGVALDGFPIYGPRDIRGRTVPVNSLNRCNGITSPTPEFPNGVYHYVLPRTTDATSSIRCFHGVVDATQIMHMPPMGPMPNMGPMPDLAAAAAKLGVTQAQLISAFGNERPPNLAKAASNLGVTEEQLRKALGVPGS